MRKLIVAASTAVLVLTPAAAASANPGPGNSFQCAPGQHDGHTTGHDKPGACDRK